MPEFLPFAGTRYRADIDPAQVTSPPFDIISTEFRDILYERNPYNAIRLEWNRDPDPYPSAAHYLEAWNREGILHRETRPAFYVYHQVFRTPDGGHVTRAGVIGRMKLHPYSEKQVLPHERTHVGPKRDRLELMERTHANFSPIFALISDPSFFFDQSIEPATAYAPIADVTERLASGERVRLILWRLDDETAQSRISHIVQNRPAIIADGHHRYETALEFHELHPDLPGAAYVMTFLTNLQAEGTVILPTDRLLRDVPNFNPYELLAALRKEFDLVPFTGREEGWSALERDDEALTLIEFPQDPKWVLVRDRNPKPRDTQELAAARLEEEIFIPILGLSRAVIQEKRYLYYPHSMRELDEMQ